MTFLENNGVKIHYFSQGSGIPLVFLNGFDGTVEMMQKYEQDDIDLLSEKYQFITMDRRGLGLSDKPLEPENNTMEKSVSDVIAVMDELEIQKAHLWGYSHGSRIAMMLAKYHPERFYSFIIGGMHPQAPTKQQIKRSQEEIEAVIGGPEALRKRIFKDKPLEPKEQQYLDEFEYDIMIAVMKGLKLHEWQDPVWLINLDHPFLFYAGENDFIGRNASSDEFRRHLKQAEFVQKMKNAKTIVVPNYGHGLPGSDTPEGKELDRQIIEFLDNAHNARI